MGYSPPLRLRVNAAPPWYNGYRFVLTFIVCTSIVLQFIAKEYISDGGSGNRKLDSLKSRHAALSEGQIAEMDEKKKSSCVKEGADGRKKGKKSKKAKKVDEEEE
jgi:hypothetical protein